MMNLWDIPRCFNQIRNQKEFKYRLNILAHITSLIKVTINEIQRVLFFANVQNDSTILEMQNKQTRRDWNVCPIVSLMSLFERTERLALRINNNLLKFRSALQKEIQKSMKDCKIRKRKINRLFII